MPTPSPSEPGTPKIVVEMQDGQKKDGVEVSEPDQQHLGQAQDANEQDSPGYGWAV